MLQEQYTLLASFFFVKAGLTTRKYKIHVDGESKFIKVDKQLQPKPAC